MNLVQIASYDNYISAHLVKGQLESEDIRCWLRDENTVTMVPAWSNAMGGIKLLVSEAQVPRAISILRLAELSRQQQIACPACNSTEVEYISTPRKAINWFMALFTWLLGDFAIGAKKVYHCFHCGHEFNQVTNTTSGIPDHKPEADAALPS